MQSCRNIMSDYNDNHDRLMVIAQTSCSRPNSDDLLINIIQQKEFRIRCLNFSVQFVDNIYAVVHRPASRATAKPREDILSGPP